MGSLADQLLKIQKNVNRLMTQEMPIVGSGGTVPAPLSVGDTLIATAGPLWDILSTPGAAGYARVSTATTEAWSQAPTWTGDGHKWLSATSAKPLLVVENTNDDDQGLVLELYKNSATPNDSDDVAWISWYANAAGPAKARMVYLRGEMLDRSSGDQAGGLRIGVLINNHDREFLTLRGYNGVVDQGEIIFNDDQEDIDYVIKAVNTATALSIDGITGHIGVLAAPHANYGLQVVTVAQTAAIVGSETTGVAVGGGSVDGIGGSFGSTNATGVFGSTAGTANNNGVWGSAGAGRGVYGLTVSGVGVQGDSATGYGLVANLTGAGTIAEFRDSGTPTLTIQDGGDLLLADGVSLKVAGGLNVEFDSANNFLEITGGRVGIGTAAPATSALLDLTSTTGALLVSRMTTAQRNALTRVNGMIIYNTSTNAFNFHEAGAWVTGSGLV